jgi:pimeloyl-ACP methyl ester carboxylesterase
VTGAGLTPDYAVHVQPGSGGRWSKSGNAVRWVQRIDIFETPAFAEQQLDLGRLRLSYVRGPANGPARVLIPAQTGTWESYQRVLGPLSRRFEVFGLDVRGHGRSTWTTGGYSWTSVGGDLLGFLEQVVQRPAIISGNSSGGLIGLWLAANLPALVSGLVMVDAPLFSAEWPRFRDRDKFVYRGLERLVAMIGDLEHRDLADYFRGTEVPVRRRGRIRVRRVPDWIVSLISFFIRRFQRKHPGEPVDIRFFPASLRLLVKSISTFDPDFARAFVDGRFHAGLDHAEALRRVTCPLLILHASWFRDPEWGLVGAMDDQDVARAKAIQPGLRYVKVEANHVVHFFRPDLFVAALTEFAADLPAGRPPA